MTEVAQHVRIELPGSEAAGTRTVSGLLLQPAGARACLVLAHGAGAGMAHPFMAALAQRLAAQGIATLRYQFPYMEQGGKRVDSPAVATATVRAAVAFAAAAFPGPLFAGGKSFGGRMSSTAQAERPLPVQGLVFVGFPLHPAGKPGVTRAAHLARVAVPMLFLQGTRDELADNALVDEVLQALGSRASLERFNDADHAFHVRKASGWNDEAVLDALAVSTARWMDAVLSTL